MNSDMKARQRAIEAERREFLKPTKRFEKFFHNLPVSLSKACRREMTIAALCTAEALRRHGVPDKERLERAEMTVLNVTFGLYLKERDGRRESKRKAA